ncbi:uncharacterized N-acetyltransferase p20 [Impatiens glandulifera]|uniref:uncharacterized N-acetyltransferase p20 n=1 Tax=Impatiens glandulifera TaxID=253017 RepID=UPI001FB1584A|nr:uncharacterized N-acetyltransferase p20 [Impatiens glandulifera]
MKNSSTPLITLRPFRLTDVDDFYLWASDDRVISPLRWTTVTSKDEAFNFIRDKCIPHRWRRSICLDDRSIGFVSVYQWSGDERCKADIGYAVATEQWGKGIASSAVKMAVNQVFDDMPELLRVQGYVDVLNTASQRVLEKAGFQKEGTLRKYTYLKGQIKDFHLYSFLSTDCSS